MECINHYTVLRYHKLWSYCQAIAHQKRLLYGFIAICKVVQPVEYCSLMDYKIDFKKIFYTLI